MDFLAFLGHIDPKSEPFVINAFQGGNGHLSGYEYFLLILGHMNRSSGTMYCQVFLCRSHHISEKVGFLGFLGHRDLVSAPMDYFLFFRPQRMCLFQRIIMPRESFFLRKRNHESGLLDSI